MLALATEIYSTNPKSSSHFLDLNMTYLLNLPEPYPGLYSNLEYLMGYIAHTFDFHSGLLFVTNRGFRSTTKYAPTPPILTEAQVQSLILFYSSYLVNTSVFVLCTLSI